MGKAIGAGVKSKAKILLKYYPEKFSGDFRKNKEVLKEINKALNPKLAKITINLMAAYITREKLKLTKKPKKKKPVVREFEPGRDFEHRGRSRFSYQE